MVKLQNCMYWPWYSYVLSPQGIENVDISEAGSLKAIALLFSHIQETSMKFKT